MLPELERLPQLARQAAEKINLPATKRPREIVTIFLQRRGRVGRLIKLFVFVPTALLFLYLVLFHSNMYLSRSLFALRSAGSRAPTDGGLGSLIGSFMPGGSGGSDSLIITAYIGSGHMLDQVGADLDLLGHYSDQSKDVLSRLRRVPTREEMLKYWQWAVKTSYDMEKGIIAVEVKAYSPEMAATVNRAVLKYSELLVNSMNQRANEDAILLASQEVERAEKRVADAADALRRFREAKTLLDPAATAQGLEKVVAELEGEAARSGAELAAALKIMREDSLGVQEIKNKLYALQSQIEREKARLAGLDTEQGSISSLVGDYAGLLLEEQFAGRQLLTAMSMYETARVQATIQARYIVPIQPPTLAEESEYPRPFLFTLLGFIAFLTLLGLVSLTIAAINDHLGV